MPKKAAANSSRGGRGRGGGEERGGPFERNINEVETAKGVVVVVGGGGDSAAVFTWFSEVADSICCCKY